MPESLNVLGGELRACCFDPLTGYYRDGSCRDGEDDAGTHVVCARMTAEFLAFSLARGNDLVTPRPRRASGASSPATAGAYARCAGWRRWRRGSPRPWSWRLPTSARWTSCRSRC